MLCGMSLLSPSLELVAPPPGQPGLKHVDVAGVPVADASRADVEAWCQQRLETRTGARVATANLDFLALARTDWRLRADLTESHLVIADGAPVAWLARCAGARKAARVAGVDLVDSLLRAPAAESRRVVLYGASERVSELAAAAITRRHPAVKIVARLCPPFRPLTGDEMRAERETIRAAEPHLVLVALGCPRQERLISEYFDCAPAALWIGVGGTLDFIAGQRRRAPALLQRAGFEWLFRLLQEPRRLWHRYICRDFVALLAIVPATLKQRL